ncbi:hypothetical protein [Aquipuribacter sp. SD81]|uniref:hypothetical protein n=1 Tax=Aquipuribacter sp. SD81 TaxID=3127703 RepID=UPI003016B378
MTRTSTPAGGDARPAWRTTVPAALGGAAVATLVTVLLLGGSGEDPDADAAGAAEASGAPSVSSAVESIAAQLAQAQAADAAALAEELAGSAEQAQPHLVDVLAGLDDVVPVDGSGGDPAAADPASWTASLETAHDELAATGTGADDQGVTRAALLGGVQLLQNAVAHLEEQDGAEALEAAARDRDRAVELWQAGALRLDSLVVEAGGEHIHLFLPPDGDPDSVPPEFRDPHDE